MAPIAPDAGIPPFTAAPTASGMDVNLISTDYLNLNGLSLTNVDVTPGTLTTLGNTECVKPIRHIYLSFDDDDHFNYTTSGAAPLSSSPNSGRVYGSSLEKDEVVEYEYVPMLKRLLPRYPVFSETNIHPSLGPNPVETPDPSISNTADDDVNALAFTKNRNVCQNTYFTVSRAAQGTTANGDVLDPGIIYKVGAGGSPIAAIFHPDLGLQPGVDINAIEFGQFVNPALPYSGGVLALLFSVEIDDPQTTEDESGGLDPKMIYYSFMDGTHHKLDSTAVLPDNIDAIALWDVTSQYQASVNPCNSNNFISPPQNLMVSFLPGGGAEVSWDPYPGSTICELRANNVNASSDKQFLVGGSPPGTPPSSYTAPASAISPGATYRVRLRCGCGSGSNISASPYTEYVFATAPIASQDATAGDMNEAFWTDPLVQIYPNPAVTQINIEGEFIKDGPIQITFSNMLGQTVLQTSTVAVHSKFSIRQDIQSLESGIYMITIQSGSTRMTRKVVVER